MYRTSCSVKPYAENIHACFSSSCKPLGMFASRGTGNLISDCMLSMISPAPVVSLFLKIKYAPTLLHKKSKMVSLRLSAEIKLAGAVRNVPPSTNAKASLRPTAFQQIFGFKNKSNTLCHVLIISSKLPNIIPLPRSDHRCYIYKQQSLFVFVRLLDCRAVVTPKFQGCCIYRMVKV